MSTWTVTAERTPRGVWVLEQPDLGAVSQCARLSQAPEEMREAISYLSGEPVDQVVVEVETILSHDLREQIDSLDRERRRLDEVRATVADGLRSVARRLTDSGLSYRDVGDILGVSHQRVAQLIAA